MRHVTTPDSKLPFVRGLRLLEGRHAVNLFLPAETRDTRIYLSTRVAGKQDKDVITITTTDVHLPHRIGHALEGAWDGELETHYDEEGWFARVTWRREQADV